MLTLQWAAFIHAELRCADAKSAFLQGDGKETQETEDVCARPLDEIACAMSTPLWDPQCNFRKPCTDLGICHGVGGSRLTCS